MRSIKFLAVMCAAPAMLGGCAVVTVASTAVSVGATAVGAGVAVGSAAVSATAAVAKGAVNVGSAVLGSDDEAKTR